MRRRLAIAAFTTEDTEDTEGGTEEND